ncbi:MAG: PhzF family phenazine biosynthesis protein [Elusimicrobiota bacterium]
MERMPKSVPFWQIDAFSVGPFTGNPAAVCLFEAEPEAALMHKIAMEMNLSETAFIWRLADGAAPRYGLRWFTPTVEVPLCGHATLASSAALFNELGLEADRLEFTTKSGTLTARRRGAGIEIDLPEHPAAKFKPPPALLAALGLKKIKECVRGRHGENLLLRIEDESELRGLAPRFDRLKKVSADAFGGVIVTARGAAPYDFISRYFCPWCGINEDPVTGSAHSMLAPYWAKHLRKKEFFAFQASARGGELRVRYKGSRVLLTGAAVTVLSGELRI